MAEKITTAHKQQIDSLTLIPGSGGCFEISADGKLIYSKLQTKQFPDEADIVRQLADLLA